MTNLNPGVGYTLLTGATGLVGRYLLRNLLMRGHRLAVLVRDKRKITAQERIETIIQGWENELDLSLPRPVCIVGDVCGENLSVSVEDRQWVEQNCVSLIHSAAILEFYGPSREREPWTTNVSGTRNVVDFCERTNIRSLHYVSTAYVCGNRNGVVKETELDEKQDFRNDYERSKFEAEQCIASRSECFDQITIYRPAVISGDSETGYTSTYHGLHLYLRLMALLVPNQSPDENGVRHTEIRLPMSGDEPRNIVPVNWVAKIICELFSNPEAHGRTFHLVPEEPVTPKLVVETCYDYFNSTGVQYCGTDNFDVDGNNKFESNFLDAVAMYRDYDRTDPAFDSTNLKRFAGHIRCPLIDAETIFRYLKFGDMDRWGRTREQKPEVDFYAEEYFSSLKHVATQFIRSGAYDKVVSRNHKTKKRGDFQSNEFVLGLDILGQGGGQWHLVASAERGCEIRRGLPSGKNSVLQMEIEEFARIFEHAIQEFSQNESHELVTNGFAFASLAEALAP